LILTISVPIRLCFQLRAKQIVEHRESLRMHEKQEEDSVAISAKLEAHLKVRQKMFLATLACFCAFAFEPLQQRSNLYRLLAAEILFSFASASLVSWIKVGE